LVVVSAAVAGTAANVSRLKRIVRMASERFLLRRA